MYPRAMLLSQVLFTSMNTLMPSSKLARGTSVRSKARRRYLPPPTHYPCYCRMIPPLPDTPLGDSIINNPRNLWANGVQGTRTCRIPRCPILSDHV
ncbi:hypothetical protein MVEN_01883200 [Mycena venus]|uniref:Uncharacterized protein n=1 Tax=Mycena venus TaxID=2733690 RepID=A0A8H6XH81_9AGAR|nr:hypothetical protein MVEN_01883200 [Mycena venus]